MLPPECPDRIDVAFEDHRLVANAGLVLPVTLAHHLGLGELVDHHVDLGDAPGQANAGDKLLTLVASALAGGGCIAAADALRAGGTEQVLGCAVKAPSTLGAFLRREKAHLGAPKAITSAAHRLARIIYAMLRYGQAYVDADVEYSESRYRHRALRATKRRAAQLGYQLVPIADAQAPVVSHASAAAVA